MNYIFAYDGGGTKTRLNVMDYSGHIVFDKTTTGSNIVSSGEHTFKSIIEGLFNDAKEALNIRNSEISFVYLGLSGADLEEDYKRLYDVCRPIFGKIKIEIANDAWIILRSGLKEPYGAVCICGTGTNSAAINKNKEHAILRALSYTLGTFGGGLDIARDALHYAFRAEEMTFKPTVLMTEIPKLLGLENMEQVIPLFYPTRTIDKLAFGSITALVDESAFNGDEVSIMILENVAKHIALQTTGVIKQLKMEMERVPVVIGGRVFQVKTKSFLETFERTLKEIVPSAYIVVPKFTPVVGAYLLALDNQGIRQTDTIEQNLLESGGKL